MVSYIFINLYMNLQIFIFQSQILHRDVQDFDLKENIWAKMEIWERNGTEQKPTNLSSPGFKNPSKLKW